MKRSRGMVWMVVATAAWPLLEVGPLSAQPALERLEKESAASPLPAPPATGARTTAAVEPGYLGIVADDVTDANRGVRLLDVLPGGPALLGGLQAGDVITSIDGRTAASLDEMASLLGARPAGDKVTFVVRRGQEVKRLDVTLGKRPPPEERRFGNFGRITTTAGAPPANPIPTAPEAAVVAPTQSAPVTLDALVPPETLPPPGKRIIPHPTPEEAAVRSVPAPPIPTLPPQAGDSGAAAPPAGGGPLLGLRAVPVTPEMQVALNLPEPRGALVVDIHLGSPAQRAGVPLEAVIVAADGKRIDSPQDLATVVQARGFGATIKLSYFRYGQLYERTVKLGDAGPVAGTPPPVLPQSVVPPPATPVSPSPLEPITTVPPAAVAPSIVPSSPVPPPPAPLLPAANSPAPGTQPADRPPVVPPTPSRGPALPASSVPAPTAAPTPTASPVPAPPLPKAAPPESETEALRRRVRELEAKLGEMEAKLKEQPK